MNKNKKVLAAILAVMLTITPFTVGCSDKEKGANGQRVNEIPTSSSNSQAQNNQKETLPEGKNIDGKMGEEVSYNNGDVKVKFDKVLKRTDCSNGEIYYLAQFTVKNNSDKKLDFGYIINFDVFIDGVQDQTVLSATAAYFAIKNYDILPAAEDINAGESKTAFVPMEINKEFKELKITYKPLPYDSNDTVTYVITPDQITLDNPK